MIREDEIKEVGKFQKTHALKGELNALLDIDADFFEEGNPLILDIDGIFVPFFLKSVRTKGSFSYLVTLDGINSEEEARKLVNKAIYAAKEDLLDYYDEEDLEFADEIAGYKAVDKERGEIGTIEGIDDSTENVLLIIESPEGDEIYIPFNEAFIDNINDDLKTVFLDLPQGMPGIDD